MATKPTQARAQAGQDWLLSCAPDPAAAQDAWEREEFAALPTGTRWRVVEAPLVEPLAAIQRIGPERVGPILADVHRDAALWLLPAGLADELDDVPRITTRPVGWVLKSPPVLHSLDGRWWVKRPDGSGGPTDPVLLGAAFGPGGYRLPAEAS
ncbi:hypothetical protein [Streptomyces olivochromogenes]|uniref:hypothetical protein n=1 Tax=Streptomyces olivochromogenes TaxID=1963 RepID=UPI001F42C04B|nr:hypothetical protein [Streptomyces olivochromogenes]MCF3132479.1 hypothetical protein [Streptomyces olivochromogenes]